MNPENDSVNTAIFSTQPPHRLSTADERLAVVFTWQTDRYAHAVLALGGLPLLSHEGTPADDWPPSPVISQLSTESIDGRPTVLGVGCSGTTHFSVSVQIDEQPNTAPAIRFDWAARLARPLSALDSVAAWLGSVYQPSPDDTYLIEPLSSAVLVSSDRVQPAQREQVRTVQWSYRVRQR